MKNISMTAFLYFLISFVIVSLGQPAWVGWLGFFASLFGYALFWASLLVFEKKTPRFFLALLWFAGVQAIQLSWMTATDYQGPYILAVYAFLIVSMGTQFALLTLWVDKKLAWPRMLAICSFWVLLEWSRLFFISGFSWNPVGLALGYHHYGLGLASVWGIYGLSFFVMLINLWALKALFLQTTSRNRAIWLSLAIFPFLFGIVHQSFHEASFTKREPHSVVLIQTGLYPEEKEPMNPKLQSFISPLTQWKRILLFLKEKVHSKVDLIVLPEAALPFGAYRPFYPLESIRSIWKEVFGESSVRYLPRIDEPLAKKVDLFISESSTAGAWRGTNAYWAKALSSYFDAPVIVGLDDHDYEKQETYNAAFYFHPERKAKRYEKRILVPLGEYIPFEWCTSLAKKFGVTDSFQPGKKVKIFQDPVPIAISICYEETYGNLIRESRKMGAELFVNITNDGWFPNSRLPWQHFEHGKVRAIENGVPIIRSCNTGITGAANCFGATLKTLTKENISSEKLAGALFLQVPSHSYFTLYSFWGDGCLIGLCSLFIAFHFRRRL